MNETLATNQERITELEIKIKAAQPGTDEYGAMIDELIRRYHLQNDLEQQIAERERESKRIEYEKEMAEKKLEFEREKAEYERLQAEKELEFQKAKAFDENERMEKEQKDRKRQFRWGKAIDIGMGILSVAAMFCANLVLYNFSSENTVPNDLRKSGFDGRDFFTMKWRKRE